MFRSPLLALHACIFNGLSSVCLLVLFYLWGLPPKHLAVSLVVWSMYASVACLAVFFVLLRIAVRSADRRERARR